MVGRDPQPLSDLTGEVPVTVADKIALSDAGLRKLVAIAIVVAFLVVNAMVLCGVWMAFNQDTQMLTRPAPNFAPKDRLVTTELLMTLVGATTVQLGALIVLMGKYIFPAPKG